ncbi:Ribokinase-like protein [Lentithecium fluviatile CBS 122367]|uniref:Ribokinase-like protein n=1 Tax=Lentithecium fluviatile CBS 122367 TaxID=1168545 RepID=A0A6G1IMH5_9PLEO|nr:Ribokinase-like protein [Lentithecium fluviatile CBS 122367]
MVKHIVCVGAVYIDTILTVLRFPVEDEKLRATSQRRRRGGNCANTLEVLAQLVFHNVSDDSDSSEAPTADPQLHLLAILPNKESQDVTFIRNSLKNVKLTNSCIFRTDFNDAAASYIIQNIINSSRTIVSHNPLPEMTQDEFFAAATEAYRVEGATEGWYHFEGRVPQVVLHCVEYLRSSQPGFKVSVECEKPERTEMALVAYHADVVFYSKQWAETQGCNSPVAFLKTMKAGTRHDALLCCTWGDEGATVLQKGSEDYEQWGVAQSWAPNNGLHVVDTIGAGDTFIAGMLYAITCHEDDWTLQQKLEFANEIAGRKVYQDGFAGLAHQMLPATNGSMG